MECLIGSEHKESIRQNLEDKRGKYYRFSDLRRTNIINALEEKLLQK